MPAAPVERTSDPDANENDRREALIEAAAIEFAENGYAGARTASIARRAGVSSQLITYYFGGKAGLLETLRARWSERAGAAIDADSGFVEAALTHADLAFERPAWSRMLAWQALERGSGSGETNPQAERLRGAIERTEQRQRDGEIRADLDPAIVQLVAHSLVLAPILLPDMVEALTGEGEPWTGYRRLLAEQLPLLLEEAGQ